jgi:hypothetical protein
MSNRLRISAVAAGVLFAVGLISPLLIPGGGSVTDKDFTDFYDSSSKRTTAYLLYFALLIGCWLMVWFFTELRTRMQGSTRVEVGYRLAIGAAVLVIVGGAIDLSPAAVQVNSTKSGFVGVPIAHALAQAGLITLIAGLFTFAAAVLLFGLAFRQSPSFPRWLGILSIVFAVLLLSSYILIGAFLLPIWAIVVGVAAGEHRSEQIAPTQ